MVFVFLNVSIKVASRISLCGALGRKLILSHDTHTARVTLLTIYLGMCRMFGVVVCCHCSLEVTLLIIHECSKLCREG